MATTGIRIIHTELPFLPFCASSVLVHIAIITLFNFVIYSDKIERANPRVQVTLIEGTSPIHKSQSTNSKPKESAIKSPPLLNARRLILPTPPQRILTPQVLKTPAVQTTIMQITTPSKLQEILKPTQRRVLQDRRATDHLNFRNHLKVVQRKKVERSTIQAQVASNSLTMTAAMPLTSIPMKIRRPTTLHSKKAGRDMIKPNVLLAKPYNSNGFSKSKAKFGGAVPLVYPLIAKKNEWEGTVRIRVLVQPNGFPETISIKKTSGHTVLDNAAIEAIRKTRFIPAKDGNIPVRSIVEIPIKFDLKNPT